LEAATHFCQSAGERALEKILQEGKSLAIRCENGPEFTSRHFLAWLHGESDRVVHISREAAAEWRVESFNGSCGTSALT